MSRGHFIGLNHHRHMLSDHLRMEAYQRAIARAVGPGMRVMDLGTGTGILAIWAAQAGATVYAVEPHAIIEVARNVVAANGLTDAISFIQADSREITLEEKVDLVITECMGNFFVSDEMQPVLRDLERHLKPGGKTLPESISLHMAGATLPLWQELTFWDEPIGGVDFSAARNFACQKAYVIACEPEFIMTDSQEIAGFPLMKAPDTFTVRVHFQVKIPATIHALVGWFNANLGNGVELSTAPGCRTHWGQMAFPVPAVSLSVNDHIELELTLGMDQDLRCHYEWRGEIIRPGSTPEVTKFSRDTRNRFLGVMDRAKPTEPMK